MVFASASGSSSKPKPKPQTWSTELPTYITVYVNKPASPTAEPPIPNDIVAFVPPAPPAPATQPRPSKPAGPGSRPAQRPGSDPRDEVDHQARPEDRRGSNRATQNQAESKPDYSPDAKEDSETAAISAEPARSYEDIFLSMNAVDLSYYSSLQEYDLVRGVAISLRHEKLILFHLDNPREYLKRFDTYTWDEEADAAAEEFIEWYVERFRPDLERQLDILSSGPAFGEAEEAIEDLTAGEEEDTLKDLTSGEAADTIRGWHKDLTNDENEVVIAIDLITGETLFVRYGDEDSVTLQDKQKKLVEDRYVALLHHHPNNSAASLADLDAGVWLDAEFMFVVNPDGTLHRYALEGDEMVALEPTHNPDYVAPADPLETLAADVAYWVQSLSEIGNPPEMVMRQGENEDDRPIDKDRRFVKDFLMDPATIVFLDDVANEYGVKDPAFFGAMVATIIYREVAHPHSLQFAGAPVIQRLYDGLEANAQGLGFHVAQVFRFLGVEINKGLDGDPSAGIGGLSSKAVRKIEEDAESKGMTLYFPHLGFDMPRRIEFDDSSQQQSVVIPIGDSLAPKYRYQPKIYPPSDLEHGVGRSVIPRFADRGLRGWRERHEPTLGYIAAEVAIAMSTSEYQVLGTDNQRITYTIGYHANRSRVPGADLYDLSDLAEPSRKQTRNEIGWARDFMESMNEIRTQIQSRS